MNLRQKDHPYSILSSHESAPHKRDNSNGVGEQIADDTKQHLRLARELDGQPTLMKRGVRTGNIFRGNSYRKIAKGIKAKTSRAVQKAGLKFIQRVRLPKRSFHETTSSPLPLVKRASPDNSHFILKIANTVGKVMEFASKSVKGLKRAARGVRKGFKKPARGMKKPAS